MYCSLNVGAVMAFLSVERSEFLIPGPSLRLFYLHFFVLNNFNVIVSFYLIIFHFVILKKTNESINGNLVMDE